MDIRLNTRARGLLKDGEHVAGASEEEVFAALGLVWIPPELREDRDEIALAAEDKLPAHLCLVDQANASASTPLIERVRVTLTPPYGSLGAARRAVVAGGIHLYPT